MKILKWAAVAVTALFALMNLGAIFEPDVTTPYRIIAAPLFLAGVAAAFGLGASQPWGRAAIIVVGGLNVVTAITGFFTDQNGAVIGVVVGGLGVVLGVLAGTENKHAAAV
jgi:hypothetical protein